ncbi:Glycerophosphoryl diester phosphodiesterase [[Mycoplasma] cavipharyngis]|uniref:glycerophosphodiester phosphodiesterase family protein n=1 Tax=[Mycoplasma] cavipharyngis TaxID=92757 RepID=UPI00370386CE
MKKAKQLLLAHRGYSSIAPENTQLSFDTANLYGFDGMELDVHLTKDKQLVIIHDETVDRTCLLKGKIENLTLTEIKKMNAAANFNVDVPKQEIMTLKEFYDRYLHLEQLSIINVEIKTDLIHYPNIEKAIHDLSIQYPEAKNKIIFSSFNFQSLEIMHQLDSKWKLGFLFWTKKQLKAVDPLRIKAICSYLHPWTTIYDQFSDDILSFKMPLCLWTIKSKKIYQKYLNDKNVIVQISNYKY